MSNNPNPIRVIVFDLNGTLYNKSSKDEFFKFLCTKKPMTLASIFEMAGYRALEKLNLINQTEFKENFFHYLDKLPPQELEDLATEFWKKEFPVNFNDFLLVHLQKMREEGVKIICATGSYEIYVKPLFNFFKVDGIIGTECTYENEQYCIKGEACKGAEKIRRLNVMFKGLTYKIVEAYSDREEAILENAERSFLVKKGKILPYFNTTG